jgi:tetratricopeptide (TPR) repeat protein
VSASSSGGVFISYRRQEASHLAGRLYDRLAARFGEDQVFMDVDSIEPGLDFTEVIAQAVGGCRVLLALIGDRWSTAVDEAGHRRLDDPDDTVRLEVEAALERDIRVIPILVEGAVMPRRQELPESLARLVRRNALRISHESFRQDAARLVQILEHLLSATADGEQGALAPQREPGIAHGEAKVPGVPPGPIQASEPPQDEVSKLSLQGLAHAEQGRYDDALRDLGRALELDPGNAATYAVRGAIHTAQRRHDDALDDLDRALELEPDDTYALARRSEVYRMKGRYHDALRDLSRVLELEPDDPTTLVARGDLHTGQGRYDDALPDLNRALELEPDNLTALASRGGIHAEQGRYDDALRDLDRVLELDPSDAFVLATRGAIYAEQGRDDDALRDLDQALELDPGNNLAMQARRSLRGDGPDVAETIDHPAVLPDEVEVGTAILLAAAARRECLNYRQFSERLRDRRVAVHWRSPRMAKLLLAISERRAARGQGLLSALVVGSASGLPGEGFFDLAARHGRRGDHRMIWEQERDRVFQEAQESPTQ